MKKSVLLFVIVCLPALALCGCKASGNEQNRLAVSGSHINDMGMDKEQGEFNFSEYNILVMNHALLGGYYEGQWIPWDELYPVMAETDYYKVYVYGRYQDVFSGGKIPETQEELYSGPRVYFPEFNYGDGEYYSLVAYSGKNDLKILKGTDIPPENEVYQRELKKYLKKTDAAQTGKEQADGFELTRIIKIDLEDDGQDEVFIQAYHFDDPNDRSRGIQYMRKVVDGEVGEFRIPLSDPTVDADYITIEGFCDLDGDGVKEILVSSMGIGYHSCMLYEFKNNEFIRVFENGGDH